MLHKVWCIGLLLLLTSFATAQYKYENLVIEPRSPVPGKKVQFTYDPSGTPLKSSQNIYAIAKMFEKSGKRYKMIAKDIALYGSSDQWKGTLTLPDSCVGFSL